MALYALLVGVDAYRPPLPKLSGGRNDVEAAARYLASRIPASELFTECLTDEQATRQAVIDGFRGHLGRAGAGDTALFWFSGHGSQAPVPPEFARLEPTGRMQTMLCVDSRHDGVPDLLDKELRILIAEVAGRGAHVAVVLDCCHADGASRSAPAKELLTLGVPALGVRWAARLESPPAAEGLLPELRLLAASAGISTEGTQTSPAAPDHVSLAACHSNQVAFEAPDAEHHYRGLFSAALLNQLGRLGPGATYRELMAGVRCRVEGTAPTQRPVLFPEHAQIVDQPFLGGPLRAAQSATSMRFLRGSWEIDAGACHGMTAGAGQDHTQIGVYGAEPAQEARVVRVLPDRSIVEPFGWVPDPEKQYPIVVTSVPLPSTTIVIGGEPEDDAATAALVEAAVRGIGVAGPAAAPAQGRPSPHLRVVDPADARQVPEIRIACPQPGVVRILRGDRTRQPQAPDAACSSPADAALVLRDLEHIARWRQIKALDNPLSGLANAVTIEVVPAAPGQVVDPRDGAALRTRADGSLALGYRWVGNRWAEPEVFVRLRNNTDRELYCVLLDLTERFWIHPDLFPGGWVAPGYPASAADGAMIRLTLPPGRAPVPGARGTDWLKVLVAEEPFGSAAFRLDRLGEPAARSAGPGPEPFSGVLDRLGLRAGRRDADAKAPPARDWSTGIVSIDTYVP
jgi:Caspase domain